MEVMVIVKATEASEAGALGGPEIMTAMGRFNQELIDAGVFVTAGGLKPTSAGKRVTFDGDKRALVDGPFTPSTEQATGFWIWQVRDLDEAIAWVKRCPPPFAGQCAIEIRPMWTMEEIEARWAEQGIEVAG